MTTTLASAVDDCRSTDGEPLAEFIRKLTAEAYDGPEHAESLGIRSWYRSKPK